MGTGRLSETQIIATLKQTNARIKVKYLCREHRISYATDDNWKVKINGIGNLFVQPSINTPEQVEFLVVIDISNLTTVTVSRISDREIHLGNWKMSCSSDSKLKVVNSGPPAPRPNTRRFTVKFGCTVTLCGEDMGTINC